MTALESEPAALALDEIVFRYGAVLALDRVSFNVPPGRFVCLLGANGAGKTTLFSIVTGLFAARQGRVTVRGHDLVRETGEALRHIGIVFQRPTLDADLTVRQNLVYFAELQGIASAVARKRIDAALERHALGEFVKRKAGTLSGGQRRRVELARALLHEPSLVLLDEPTVGLDAPSRADFCAHVRSLSHDDGVGILWATHLMDEVHATDRVCVLDRGKLVANGELSELLASHDVPDVHTLAARLMAISTSEPTLGITGIPGTAPGPDA